ncbi:MAG: hypothetical protein ACRDJ2_16620, partial [Actinomycetota bacterium]
LHRGIGFAIPAAFLVLAVASLVGILRNRNPGDWYWSWLGILQVIVGIQFVVGAVLFLAGGRPPGGDLRWLHYVYGAFFPFALLLFAHRAARERFREVPAIPFGIAAFLCFGLTARALMTGLGIGA